MDTLGKGLGWAVNNPGKAVAGMGAAQLGVAGLAAYGANKSLNNYRQSKNTLRSVNNSTSMSDADKQVINRDISPTSHAIRAAGATAIGLGAAHAAANTFMDGRRTLGMIKTVMGR
jgi:hypothetical protein